jgi:putative tryptophan/tyrosine transport system substrate-binding protein
MQRREFVTILGGAAAAWPLAAGAQQPNRVRRIGVLMNGTQQGEPYPSSLRTFTQTLQKLGWREPDNVQIDVRWSEGDVERMRAYAIELVGLASDIILASGTANLTAVLRATRSIPVVFTLVSDPVAQGFVASLPRPGDNITGFSAYEFSIGGKWVDLLKQMAPSLARVAVMWNPDNAPQTALFVRSIEAAAPLLGVEVVTAPVHNAAEIERAIENLSRQPNSGLLIYGSFTMEVHHELIIALTRRHRLPNIGSAPLFVKNGGLMSYVIDYDTQFRQAAVYVDRFLKGTKLADLPVQLPTKFTLAINLKAAAALGIDVPLGLLLSVDEVIE